MFDSHRVRVLRLEGGLVELCFDRQGESINKLDMADGGHLVRAL